MGRKAMAVAKVCTTTCTCIAMETEGVLQVVHGRGECVCPHNPYLVGGDVEGTCYAGIELADV